MATIKILIILIGFWGHSIHASTSLFTIDPEHVSNFGFKDPFEYLESKSFYPREVEASPSWKTFKGQMPLGSFHAPVWLRFAVKVAGETPFAGQLVFTGSFVHKNVDVYLVHRELSGELTQVEHKVAGWGSESPKPLASKQLGVTLTIPAQKTYEIYLRIESEDIIRNDLQFFPEAKFQIFTSRYNHFIGLYEGFFLVMIILALFHGRTFKEPAFYWYGAYGLATFFTHHSYANTLALYLDLPRWYDPTQIRNLILIIFPMTAIQFVRHWLKTYHHLLLLDLVAKTLLGCYILNVVLVLLRIPQVYLSQFNNGIGFLSVLLGFAFGWGAIIKGVPFSRRFMLAWTFLGIGSLVFIFGQLGIIENTVYVLNAPLVGQTIEFILLNFAIQERIYVVARARDKAEIAAKEGERSRAMLRVLSHDMANHISVVQGSASVLCSRYPSDQAPIKKLYERILRAANQQSEILTHVRELMAIRDGKVRLALSSVSLGRAAQQAVLNLETFIENKSIKVVIKGSEEIYVFSDERSLVHQVLSNILSNAVKFSDRGSQIDIEISQSGQEAKLVMADAGIGMTDDQLKQLFDVAAVTSTSGTNGESGTGYGMPLVNSYMQEYGGSVEVVSRNRHDFLDTSGTVFTLKFRLAPAPLDMDLSKKI